MLRRFSMREKRYNKPFTSSNPARRQVMTHAPLSDKEQLYITWVVLEATFGFSSHATAPKVAGPQALHPGEAEAPEETAEEPSPTQEEAGVKADVPQLLAAVLA